jgi:small subunit ribosomal protein S12
MTTFRQNTFQKARRFIRKSLARSKRCRCTRFFGSPFKRGQIEKIRIEAPKKPNSAKRKVAKIKLCNGREILAKIPGQGHNLQKFSEVIVRGGRARDTPGIHYIIIKGKMSFSTKKDLNENKRGLNMVY